jgi:hypothetical protein
MRTPLLTSLLYSHFLVDKVTQPSYDRRISGYSPWRLDVTEQAVQVEKLSNWVVD